MAAFKLIFLVGCLGTILSLVESKGFDITGSIALDGVKGPDGGDLRANVNLHITNDGNGDDGNGDTDLKPTNEDCEPLKSLLAEFVLSHEWTVVNDLIKSGFMTNGVDGLWAMIEAKTTINLKDSKERDRFVCLIYDASNGNQAAINTVSEKTSEVLHYYEMALQSIVRSFGFDGLLTMTEVFKEYASWLRWTGYPTVPVKNLGTEEQLVFLFEDWRERLLSTAHDDDARKELGFFTRTFFFPMDISSKKLAEMIKSASTTEELMKELGYRYETYLGYMETGSPEIMSALANLAEKAIGILKELEKLGILPQ